MLTGQRWNMERFGERNRGMGWSPDDRGAECPRQAPGPTEQESGLHHRVGAVLFAATTLLAVIVFKPVPPRTPSTAARSKPLKREQAETVRRLREAERPLLADLAGIGLEVESVWNLCKVPKSRPNAIPVLLDHLTRDYPDRVLMGIGIGLDDKSVRAWWPQLKALYLQTKHDVVRDRMAAVLSNVATRAHYDDLLFFLGIESLGDTRVYFLRPVNRIGNRMSPRMGRAAVESLADNPVFAKEATAILARRSRNA